MAASSSKPDKYLRWIEVAQAENPALAQQLSQFGELYQRRLWHQLTVALEAQLETPAFQKASVFLPKLYNNFIAGFAYRLNLLRLAKIAVAVSKHFTNSDEGSKSTLYTTVHYFF